MATNWTRLIREHGPLVYRTAWRILGHTADAEDVVQDVFLQMHQWEQTRPVRSMPGLLRRMATCRALDRLRQRKATVPLTDLPQEGINHAPDAPLLEEELQEKLRLAVAELPEREAEVFCLRYFDELSYQEIATELGIRRGAVAAALHKARLKLETVLLTPAHEIAQGE